MPVITSGHVNLSPITLKTTATLEQIRDAMRLPDNRYQGQVPGGGYGSIDDDDGALRGRLTGRPSGGEARIEAAEQEWPERLLARYWWNEPDKALADVPNVAEGLLWSLNAVDLMIVKTDLDNELVAYISMKQSGRGFVPSVVETLRALVESLDPGATVSTYMSPVGFGDDDFFRWLLYRHLWSSDVGRIKIKAINEISGIDPLHRPSVLTKGADVNSRPELLALLSGKATAFGPAKFQLFDNDLQLDAILELRQDGGFSPNVGACRYVGKRPPESIFRLSLVNDLAFGSIPELRSAYYSDKEYAAAGRDKFRKHCRETLVAALTKTDTNLGY